MRRGYFQKLKTTTLVVWSWALGLSALAQTEWVIVGPANLLVTARPLIEHRRSQGLKPTLLTADGRGVAELIAGLEFKPEFRAMMRPA